MIPSYHVERVITVKQSKSKLKNILTDLRQMRKWSPWLIVEPDAKVTFNTLQGKVGAMQTWEGEMVGFGSLELTEIHNNQLVYSLQFLKPFRSQSQVTFELTSEDKATKVSWNMYGKMPWFLFFMTKVMKTYIGMDYERGLKMLKEYAETGKISSKLELVGEEKLEAIHYIGLKNSCLIQEIGEVMGRDFHSLGSYRETHQVSNEYRLFSIYHQFDMMKDHTTFVSCMAIDPDTEVAPPFIKGKIEPYRVLTVRHIGDYQHLGNAWSLAMNVVRSRKLRINKKSFGYEFYLNSSHDLPPTEWITEIMIPLK